MSSLTLRPAQIDDLSKLIANDRWGLWHDPACGKTPPVCVWAWWLWSEKQIKTAFVMPKSLLAKNRDEMLAWSEFQEEDVKILEAVPAGYQTLYIYAMAFRGWIRRSIEIDVPMNHILFAAESGVLKQRGAGDFHKPSLKKAIKNGWITPELSVGIPTETPKKIIYRLHQPGKKATTFGSSKIEAMISAGTLSLDEKGRVRLTETGLKEFTNGELLKEVMIDAKVILVGFDYWSENHDWIEEYNPEFQAVAVDEIHHRTGYGNHNSSRTGKFYESMRKIKRFVPMTGTLVDGRLDSVYPTIKTLEPRYYASFEDFMGQHATLDIFGKLVGWKNHDKIKTILARHGTKRTFEEVHGKENKIIIRQVVEMSPAQRVAYDQFHEQAMLELEKEILDGTLPGVACLRARQIMQCPEVFGIGASETTGKDEFLRVHLENRSRDGKQLIIFAVFKAEQSRIVNLVKEYGLSVDLINSDVSTKQRTIIDRAVRSEELQVVVCSPPTAGVGFNWGGVNDMIFASVDYQDSNFVQAYRRAVRGARETPLRIYVPEYAHSMDQRIFYIMDKKARDAKLIDDSREVLALSSGAGGY